MSGKKTCHICRIIGKAYGLCELSHPNYVGRIIIVEFIFHDGEIMIVSMCPSCFDEQRRCEENKWVGER